MKAESQIKTTRISHLIHRQVHLGGTAIAKRPPAHTLLTLFAIVSLSGIALAANVLHGHGSFTGRASVASLGGNIADLTINASGNVTHLGKSRVQLHTVADFSGPVPVPTPPSTGTITAANGDRISFVLRWTVTEVEPGVFRTSGPFDITSGTGRFNGASGGGTYDGLVDLNTGAVTSEITGDLVR